MQFALVDGEKSRPRKASAEHVPPAAPKYSPEWALSGFTTGLTWAAPHALGDHPKAAIHDHLKSGHFG